MRKRRRKKLVKKYGLFEILRTSSSGSLRRCGPPDRGARPRSPNHRAAMGHPRLAQPRALVANGGCRVEDDRGLDAAAPDAGRLLGDVQSERLTSIYTRRPVSARRCLLARVNELLRVPIWWVLTRSWPRSAALSAPCRNSARSCTPVTAQY